MTLRRCPTLALLACCFTVPILADTTPRTEIRIRDPFVLPDPEAGVYYIYGTTTSGIFDGNVERKAVMVFRSTDLQHWEDPVPVWEIPEDH